MAQNHSEQTCPGCATFPHDLKKHMVWCCPEILRARSMGIKPEDGMYDEEFPDFKAHAVQSMARIADPLLRRAVQLRFGHDPGGKVRTAIEVAEALGNKCTPEKANTLIRRGMRTIPMVADDPSDTQIIYEDDELLAVNKPPFLRSAPVHRFVGNSLTNRILGIFQQRQNGNATTYPRALHRLDSSSSGVVLFAKTKTAAGIIHGAWHTPDCTKQYLAIARKRLGAALSKVGESVVVKAPICRTTNDTKDPYFREINFELGKKAATRFTVVATGLHGALLLSCLLVESGRTHQIRIHAAHAGLPLEGDEEYGVSANGTSNISRVALHAWRLRVQHPVKNTSLLIEAPLPTDLTCCLGKLGIAWGDVEPVSLADVREIGQPNASSYSRFSHSDIYIAISAVLSVFAVSGVVLVFHRGFAFTDSGAISEPLWQDHAFGRGKVSRCFPRYLC